MTRESNPAMVVVWVVVAAVAEALVLLAWWRS